MFDPNREPGVVDAIEVFVVVVGGLVAAFEVADVGVDHFCFPVG